MLGNLFARRHAVPGSATDRLEQDREAFKYCPACGDEFRAEFDHCAACDQPLVSAAGRPDTAGGIGHGPGAGPPAQPLSAEDTLVSVKQGPLMDLKQVGRLLEKHGIASLVVGDGPNRGGGCCASSSFILQVRDDDAARAGTILAEDFRRSTALDEHRLSPERSGTEIVYDERLTEKNCPACGCRFVPDEQSCPECGLCF